MLPQGWCPHEALLVELLQTYRPMRGVELGTWRGRSAIITLKAMEPWGGVLYCVDTWTGDQGETSHWGRKPGDPHMVHECAAKLVTANVADRARLIVSTTTQAAKGWIDGEIDYLYIDADHNYASVLSDLIHWYPLVRDGGLVCGDDYRHPNYPGVQDAWDEFMAKHRKNLKAVVNDEINFAWCRK